MKPILMAVINLTPDSFWEASRVNSEDFLERAQELSGQGADMLDLGAYSSRPGADEVGLEQEWERLRPALLQLKLHPELCWSETPLWGGQQKAGIGLKSPRISIDTTRAEIVRRAQELIGTFVVNDISSGEDDCEMLPTVAALGLSYIAMHKRGTPKTMDGLCEYEGGIIEELLAYFQHFSEQAERLGIRDWVIDPGLGFAKDTQQNWQILEQLERLAIFNRPILIGAADKRFTAGDTPRAHRIAIEHGANILRVHEL